MEEIRWKQRFENFEKAFNQLSKATALATMRNLSDLEQQGLIQSFEYTHELAWKVIKDYFFHQGNSTITGSRDATRTAFQAGLIEDGEGWMEMIKSRNQSSHTYDEDTASTIATKIIDSYHDLLGQFYKKMETLKQL
jgi:nucleotidyltransferase substrate binding protein (TIGR01987 family)